jgi:hypothetical protein
LKDVQIVKFQALCTAIIVLNLGGLSMAAEKAKTPGKEEKGTVHTVTASMDYPTNGGVGIRAEKRPGEFTIPKGTKGTKLKYNFFNPKSGNTLTKLNGSNIYSVTEKRYMHELDHNPDFELPAGDYKFVVGGDPGATGTLAYTTVPSNGDDTNPPPKTPPPHGTTKRNPTDKTDKTEDKSTVTVSPGGSKKKVVVELSAEGSQAKYDAWLTINGNKLTLDFILPDAKFGFDVVKNTWRLEGTLEKDAKGTTASGKSNYESNSIYKHGHNTRFTVDGTFSATLEGNVLTGSVEDHTAWASDGAPPTWRRKLRWRIEGFSP